ncbi:MAG: sugar dehydrogenase complex small subunit [Gammaproteobacteria bacterium]
MEKSRRQFLKDFAKGAAAIAAVTMIEPALSAMPDNKQSDFNVFMQFSILLTDEENLNKDFGELCWRYTQQHSKPEHMQAMHRYVEEQEATAREQMLSSDPALKSIAYHTLLVWYKGDVMSINPTKDEIKLAHVNALKWRAMGVPARGVCNPTWSQVCTML